MNGPLTLAPASIEQIAERIAELLRGEPTSPDLIDAAEVARRFGISRAYVYEHADRLGARRLGDGPRARLRFDPTEVAAALAPSQPLTSPDPPRRRRRPSSHPVELLPIGRNDERRPRKP